MDLALFLLYLLIGIIAGVMSGTFGIGGGSVRIPLMNIAGLSLKSAFGTNLVVIPISSLIGSISQKENIDLDLARYVIFGGIFGSLLGALLTGFFSPFFLAIIFFIVSIITILGIYLEKIFPILANKVRNWSHANQNIVIGIFFLNLITGLRGGSGGSLFPSFLRMTRLDIHKAIATSLFSTIFTALAAVLVYWLRGNIELLPTIAVLVGSMIGVRIGSYVSLKTKPMWLEAGLSVLVLFLALLTVLKTLV